MSHAYLAHSYVITSKKIQIVSYNYTQYPVYTYDMWELDAIQ